MKAHFFELADALARDLAAGEVLLCNFAGERSDFVRFNHGRVRQAGSVTQRSLSLRLVRGARQASAGLALAGNGEDRGAAQAMLAQLRGTLDALPDDPWLLYNEAPQSTEDVRRGALAPPEAVLEHATRAARGLDLVGFYAGGTLYRGFANSLGQRNWHEADSFSFDWSLYRRGDQAVKRGYAGFAWDEQALAERIAAAEAELGVFDKPREAIAPGEYRAYLAPRALEELVGLLAWGGFSARARETRQSPLLRMQQGQALSAKLTLRENTAEGLAPRFQADGFVRPAQVTLIAQGRLGEPLVSPRSAREYGLPANAANGREAPEALDMAAGDLAGRDALAALGEGLYVSNLWYLNYSDRAAGRVTGMTRFATWRVAGGRIVAPLAAMRFDDSIYRMLGENLLELTRERELLPDPSTYESRSTASARLPGALLRALRFTL